MPREPAERVQMENALENALSRVADITAERDNSVSEVERLRLQNAALEERVRQLMRENNNLRERYQ